MDVVNNVIAAMLEDLTPQQLQKLAAVLPIQEVQRMAGHKKIDTTMMYVSVSDGAVKASYRRFIA